MLIAFSCIWPHYDFLWNLLSIQTALSFHTRPTLWKRNPIWQTPASRHNLSTIPWRASVTTLCSVISAGIKAQLSTLTLRVCGRKKPITGHNTRWNGPGWRGGKASLPSPLRTLNWRAVLHGVWNLETSPFRQGRSSLTSLPFICSSA